MSEIVGEPSFHCTIYCSTQWPWTNADELQLEYYALLNYANIEQLALVALIIYHTSISSTGKCASIGNAYCHIYTYTDSHTQFYAWIYILMTGKFHAPSIRRHAPVGKHSVIDATKHFCVSLSFYAKKWKMVLSPWATTIFGLISDCYLA